MKIRTAAAAIAALISLNSTADIKIYDPKRDLLGFKIEQSECEGVALIKESALIFRSKARYTGPDGLHLEDKFQVVASDDGQFKYYLNDKEKKEDVYFNGIPVLETWHNVGENFSSYFDNIDKNLFNGTTIMEQGTPVYLSFKDLFENNLLPTLNSIDNTLNETASTIDNENAINIDGLEGALKSINDISSALDEFQSLQSELEYTGSDIGNLITSDGIPTAIYLLNYISEQISPIILSAVDILNTQAIPVSNNIANDIEDQNLEGLVNVGSLNDIPFSSTGMTIGNLVEAIKFLDGFSETDKGDNHYKQYIYLPATAYAELNMISSVDYILCNGDILKYDNGYSYSSSFNGLLSAELSANWEKDGTLGDISDLIEYLNLLPPELAKEISDIELYKAGLSAHAGFDATTINTGEEFYIFEYHNFIIGVISSKIEKERQKEWMQIEGSFSPSSLTASTEFLRTSLEENTIDENEIVVLEKTYPNTWGNISFMSGFNTHSHSYELDIKKSGNKYTLDKNGITIQQSDDTYTEEHWTKHSMLYGLATSIHLGEYLTVHGNFDNYQETIGTSLETRFINGIITDDVSEGYVTIWGNKTQYPFKSYTNPFKEYFMKQNIHKINHVGVELQNQELELLYRQLEGGFLTFSQSDDEQRVGVIFARNDSYLAGGIIIKEFEDGFFTKSKIGKFGLNLEYLNFKKDNLHGEECSIDAMYFTDNMAIGLRLETEGQFLDQFQSAYLSATGVWPIKFLSSVFN